MCIQNTLQQHILDITDDGKDVANFLYATMHGLTPHAKIHHQMEAAKHLTKLALHTTPSPSSQLVIPAQAGIQGGGAGSEDSIDTPSPSTGEDHDESENLEKAEGTSPSSLPSMSATVTDSDIINYKVARLIREETNDGYFIAEFLSRVMHDAAGQGRPISEADRMAAARELLNRGLGRFGDTRDRRISNTQEDRELINSGLSRYIREHTDNGLGPARFLLNVASGWDEGFTMHQRVTATRELIRRGWDTNCDSVTPDDITAYYERQEAREPTGYDNRLQEWREKEREQQSVGATGRSPEDEPQLEAGLFAHLSFDEIDRYEAMSAEEQAEFVEKQRQYRATRKSAGALAYDPLSLRERAGLRTEAPSPSSQLVIPAQAGIQGGRAGSEDRTDTPSPSTKEGRDGRENPVHGEPVEPPVASSVRPEPAEGPAQHTTPSPSSQLVIPAQAGIQWRGAGGKDPENINLNTPPQNDALSTNTPYPNHPVNPVKSQPHIRSP